MEVFCEEIKTHVFLDVFHYILGVNVYLYTNLTETFEECDSEAIGSLKTLPDTGIVPVRMRLNVSGINFHLPKSLSADLPALLKCVDKTAVSLPSLFGSYRSPFDVKEIIMNHSKHVF